MPLIEDPVIKKGGLESNACSGRVQQYLKAIQKWEIGETTRVATFDFKRVWRDE